MPRIKHQSRVAAPTLIVNQLALATIASARSRITQLGRELGSLEARAAAAEGEVMALLRTGAVIEPGPLVACLDVKLGACRPAWKEIHIGHMAEHGVPEATVEEAARQAYPAKLKEILVVSVRSSKGGAA